MDERLGDVSQPDLEATIAPFGQDRTLPAAAYTSMGVFDWEMSRLWERGWVCVGRCSGFPLDSSREVRVGRESIIVTNHSGQLRAFYNVCRHRGHEILKRGQTSKTAGMQCPYHGWVYRLDGAVRTAPKMRHRDDLEGATLIEVRLVEWHGWAMIAADDRAPAFSVYVGELDELVGSYSPGCLEVGATQTYELRSNWKFVHENYHECYHCSSIHPQFVKVADPNSGDNYSPHESWVGGTLQLRDGLQTVSMDGRSSGRTIDGVPPGLSGKALYVGLIPNLLVSCHPDYVLTHRLVALGPDRTVVECEWLFPEPFVESGEFDPAYAVELWDITNRQDWAACESLQRGASSRGHRPGFLSEGEDAVHQFLGKIAASYLD